jgi:glutaminyl-peptide cyclotransferase
MSPTTPLALLLASVALLGACGRAGAPPLFDGERAFADLSAQVALGPRPAGSEASARTRDLIRERLRQAGWPVEEHAFEVTPEGGPSPVRMVNLIATKSGQTPSTLIVGAHYDTKAIPDVRFVGANDGASGVAVLLELARSLGAQPEPLTLQLVFFDGEEAFGPRIYENDGLFGSRALSERMQQDGSLAQVRGLILLDMIGDRDLNLAVDLHSSPELLDLLQRIGGDLVDPAQRMRIIDDHVPFLQRGLRDVLLLIDFQYGSRVSPGPLWHTESDDLDGVSADSLNRVGRVAVELVRRIQSGVAAGRATRPRS